MVSIAMSEQLLQKMILPSITLVLWLSWASVHQGIVSIRRESFKLPMVMVDSTQCLFSKTILSKILCGNFQSPSNILRHYNIRKTHKKQNSLSWIIVQHGILLSQNSFRKAK